MKLEKELADWLVDTNFDDLPQEPLNTARNVVLSNLGTIIAGATAEGCETMVNLVKEWGGKREATILIYGGNVPAYNAAFCNSVMARALDYDDAMYRGMHVGSSSVPTALAVAELAGGCSGQKLLTALVVASEVCARIHDCTVYNGFDPTGICTIFATAAVTGKILDLNSEQMLNALALAFNRSGGSFQSNIDGSLAVRAIQGFASQGGIICAQLAQKGVTGPKNFLEGTYGYFHLYAGDRYDPQALVGGLGERFEFNKTGFKKYPSCGGTSTSTDAVFELIQEKGLTPGDVARIDIKVDPYHYKLVGHPFELGDNPKVNAQFNIQYCVANALLRKSARLQNFDESYVRDPKVMELIEKIYVTADPALEKRGMSAVDMQVTLRQGIVYHKSVDEPSGLSYNRPMTEQEHLDHFEDCVSYAGRPLPPENTEKIRSLVSRLEELEDVRDLIPLLVS